MMHEVVSQIQADIQAALCKNEVRHKSVRIARYREASYFAGKGSFVYFIVDYPIGESPTFCYVGETTHLGKALNKHQNNHHFTHVFVVDMFESDESERKFAKNLLIDKFNPIFQNNYYPFEKYRTNNFERVFSTKEAVQWNESRFKKVH